MNDHKRSNNKIRLMHKPFHKDIVSFIAENSTSSLCSYTAFGNAIAVSAAGGKAHVECPLPIPFCERVKSLEKLLYNKLSVNFPMLHLFNMSKNPPDPFIEMIKNIMHMAASGEYELIVITDFYPIFEAGIFSKEQLNELIRLTNKNTALILTGRTQYPNNIIGEKFFFTSVPDNITLPCHMRIDGPEKEKRLLCLGLASLSALSGITTACSTSICDEVQFEFMSKIIPAIEFIFHKEQSHNMAIIEEDSDEKETKDRKLYHIEIKNWSS